MKKILGRLAQSSSAAIGFGMNPGCVQRFGMGRPGGFAPEIDPGSMASAMTLLVGGMLMITGRRRRR
jgi:hypothetical protein